MVRIDRVATTKTDANRVPAVPTFSARCEVSIGTNQTSGKGFADWNRHHNVHGPPLIYGEKATFIDNFAGSGED
jgi:hypothetical protein